MLENSLSSGIYEEPVRINIVNLLNSIILNLDIIKTYYIGFKFISRRFRNENIIESYFEFHHRLYLMIVILSNMVTIVIKNRSKFSNYKSKNLEPSNIDDLSDDYVEDQMYGIYGLLNEIHKHHKQNKSPKEPHKIENRIQLLRLFSSPMYKIINEYTIDDLLDAALNDINNYLKNNISEYIKMAEPIIALENAKLFSKSATSEDSDFHH